MATNEETTTIDLQNDVTLNGIKYSAGTGVKVPKASAEDLKRMDEDYQQYERNLLVRRTSNVDGGTFSVGNGAE